MTQRIKKYILVTLGTITLILGVVGIFIPLLPTTPFLLITSFCYLRSSQSLHDWLLGHRLLGPYIADYVQYRTVRRKTKILALATLWPSLGLSMFIVQRLFLQILLASIGTIVSIHIIRLPTSKLKVSIAAEDSQHR